MAVGTDGGEVTDQVRLRGVIDHVFRRHSWCATLEAVQLPGLAFLLIPCSSEAQKCHQITSEDQYRAMIVAYRQPFLDPLPHRVLVDRKESGNLIHCVSWGTYTRGASAAKRTHRS